LFKRSVIVIARWLRSIVAFDVCAVSERPAGAVYADVEAGAVELKKCRTFPVIIIYPLYEAIS
jgi:hypothetical protein